MNSITLLFLIVLAASIILQLWLIGRQLTHVRDHRERVPEAFSDRIQLKDHQLAADYTVTRTRIGILELLVGSLWLLVWTLGHGLELLDGLWQQLELDPLVTGVVVILSVFLVMGILELPFSLYRTFGIEKRFGFNLTTPALFITDLCKQTLLLLIIGTPLIWVILWLMQSAGYLWWLYAWAVWMGFSLLMMWAFPAFIAPLFNKFLPLEDTQLKQKIEQLLERCGFISKGIFVMDGSKRSSHSNAYFTGLGKYKRIVFFDTLVNSLEPNEIEAVLAHELGHFKNKHIQKRILYTALSSLCGLALLGWLMQQPVFYHSLGVSNPTTHTALILFLMIIPVFSIYLQPVLAYFSRKHEFEADDFAAQKSDAYKLISALVKLYKENANTLTPDPIYSAFHDSHPPAPVRIAHLANRDKKEQRHE